MRIVIVTGDGLEHKYVTNALTENFDIDAILVCEPAPRQSWKAVLKRTPLKFLDKSLRKIFLLAIRDSHARVASLLQVLGQGSESFDKPDLVRAVGRPKDGMLASVVADLEPDILAVYGTSIIPAEVLSIPNQVALNMHTGLSPEYRGVSCAFWPIRDGRPDMVGATVHECTSNVDGGRIYFRNTASLEPNDDLHSIFARAVVVGAEGYIKVVRDALSKKLKGLPQDLSQGQEFTGSQIGIWSEISTRLALKRLRKTDQLQNHISPL